MISDKLPTDQEMTNSDVIRDIQTKWKDLLEQFKDQGFALPGEVDDFNEALKLLSSPAIVGVEPVPVPVPGTINRAKEEGAMKYYSTQPIGQEAYRWGFADAVKCLRDHGYLSAQAPQSSPAPVMNIEQLKEVAKEWWRRKFPTFDERLHANEVADTIGKMVEFAEHVLSLSPAQGAMPQVDKIMEVVKDWRWDKDGISTFMDMDDLRSRLSSLLKLPQ